MDLSDLAVMVPTTDAGRQVREALAEAAAKEGAAVLSPHLMTPEMITVWAQLEMPQPASAAEELLLWMQQLRSLPVEDFAALFPEPPPSRDMAWARCTAGELLRLRHRLEEGGHTMVSAAKCLGSGHPEASRWQSLAALERRLLHTLRCTGLDDPVGARLAAAAKPVFPAGVKRIALLCVPDPVQLVITALEAAENNGMPADVLIHAPEAQADSFDAWGRPMPEVWGTCHIEIPEPRQRIVLCTRPEDEASALVEALRDGSGSGSADPEVTAPLLSRACAQGLSLFDPNGSPLARHSVSAILQSLSELLHHDSADAAGLLMHIPAVLECSGQHRRGTAVLREWDEFRAAHLPRTLNAACDLLPVWRMRSLQRATAPAGALAPVLEWLRALCCSLRRGNDSAALTGLLESLAATETLSGDPLAAQALDHWTETLDALQAAAARTGVGLEPAHLLDCALHLLRDTRLYHDNAAGDAVLSGWLELAWHSAPHLAVAGLNEGMAPDSVTGDPWIPDSARGQLNLKTNAVRLARDSYLLTALIESRRRTGSVTLLCARESTSGDPLRPSRLLLRCPDNELPARTLFLFPKEASDNAASTPPSWTRAWKLKVPPPDRDASIFDAISVTQFSDYLRCPFRFYLKHVLKMEPFDAAREEMDQREFGSLLHDTIERLHREEALRNSFDISDIASFLDKTVQDIAGEKYGPEPALPVMIQLESARSRLRTMAEIHAAQRAEGWRTEYAEVRFPELPGNREAVSMEGLTVRGRIDLIERHKDTGARRVLDYKTGKPSPPAGAHLKALKGAASGVLPPWQLCQTGGKVHAWTNLQLPFYLWIIRQFLDGECAAGYFNLPAAATEAGVQVWEDFDDDLVESAAECARGIIRNIKAGVFWPPAARVDFDDYKHLIHGTVEDSFDAELLEQFRQNMAQQQRPG